MTSQKKLPLAITLLVILSLILAACERPLPDDGSGDVPGQEVPAPEVYPGPGSAEGSTEAGQPPADSELSGSGYPGGEAELVQPAEEGAAEPEAYPPAEGEQVEGETGAAETQEGETAAGETSEETPGGEGQATDESAGEPTAEGEMAEAATPEAGAAEGEPAEGETAQRTHTVAAGDNLYQIGLKYGVSWVAIAQANGIVNPDSLTIGQVLVIPDAEESDSTATTAETTTEEPTATPEPSDSSDTETTESTEPGEAASTEGESGQTTYIVQSGDNLYRISLMFGVNMMDVARANGLANFDDLAVGQELIIPGVDATDSTGAVDTTGTTTEPAAVEPTGAEVSHTVLEGETVFGIAFQYGIAWTKLVERNNLTSPYTLETGQVLIIPAEE